MPDAMDDALYDRSLLIDLPEDLASDEKGHDEGVTSLYAAASPPLRTVARAKSPPRADAEPREECAAAAEAAAAPSGRGNPASPDSSTPSGCEGGARTAEKRQSAREASRKYRQKRRERAVTLLKRNRELVQETELLRVRASDLRAELDALRYAGTADLEKENALLRLEIERHKHFIERVVTQARQPSLQTMVPEERYRLLQGTVESGVCHSLSLAYASATDPSWQRSPTCIPPVRCANGKYVSAMETKFQYRPINVPRSQAMRINTRFEAAMPMSAEAYFSQRSVPCVGTVETAVDTVHVTKDITPPEFSAIEEALGERECLRVFQLEIRRKMDGDVPDEINESVFVVAKSSVDVCLSAVFPDLCRRHRIPAGFTSRALVHCTYTLHGQGLLNLSPGQPSEDSADPPPPEPSHKLSGLIACSDPTDPGKCWSLVVNSIDSQFLRSSLLLPGIPSGEEFDAEGRMHPKMQQEILRMRAANAARLVD